VIKFIERLFQPEVESQGNSEDSTSENKVPLLHTRPSGERDQKLINATMIGAGAFGIASALVVVVNGVLPNAFFSPVSENAPTPVFGYAFSDESSSSTELSSSLTDHCEGKSTSLDCILKPEARSANQCQIAVNELSAADLEVARIAWKYFENNYNESTGLVTGSFHYSKRSRFHHTERIRRCGDETHHFSENDGAFPGPGTEQGISHPQSGDGRLW